mgnify:CR=1 FL=1
MKKLLILLLFPIVLLSQNQFLDSILQVRDQRIDEVFNRNIIHGDVLKNRIDSIIGPQEPISGYNYILKVANMEGFEKDVVLISKDYYNQLFRQFRLLIGEIKSHRSWLKKIKKIDSLFYDIFHEICATNVIDLNLNDNSSSERHLFINHTQHSIRMFLRTDYSRNVYITRNKSFYVIPIDDFPNLCEK